MRGVLIGLLSAVLVGLAPAYAQTPNPAATPPHVQTSIILHADPVPIVDAQIETDQYDPMTHQTRTLSHPARLEVDLRISDGLIINPAATARLDVQPIHGARSTVSIEGRTRLLGRLAHPRVLFEGNSTPAFATIFPSPVTTRADGVIGPGSLPYDVVTVVLGPEPAGARDLVFPLDDPNRWILQGMMGDLEIGIEFDVSRNETMIGRTLATVLDGRNRILPDGDLIDSEVILGLSTKVQPVRTTMTMIGFPISPALARTTEPLHGPNAQDEWIVVSADPPPPRITLGRTALAKCASISVNRVTGMMTLRCAP